MRQKKIVHHDHPHPSPCLLCALEPPSFWLSYYPNPGLYSEAFFKELTFQEAVILKYRSSLIHVVCPVGTLPGQNVLLLKSCRTMLFLQFRVCSLYYGKWNNSMLHTFCLIRALNLIGEMESVSESRTTSKRYGLHFLCKYRRDTDFIRARSSSSNSSTTT